MAVYERIDGTKEGARAILHEYPEGCKLVLTITPELAKRLMDAAVSAGGTCDVQMTFVGTSETCQVVGARIDSVGDDGKRIGGTGLIEFASLKKRS